MAILACGIVKGYNWGYKERVRDISYFDIIYMRSLIMSLAWVKGRFTIATRGRWLLDLPRIQGDTP